MFRCPNILSAILLAAGGAFLLSALLGSFWVELALGAMLCGFGILIRHG